MPREAPARESYCRRCRQSSRMVGEILDGICGSCADDLRDEAKADEADRKESTDAMPST